MCCASHPGIAGTVHCRYGRCFLVHDQIWGRWHWGCTCLSRPMWPTQATIARLYSVWHADMGSTWTGGCNRALGLAAARTTAVGRPAGALPMVWWPLWVERGAWPARVRLRGVRVCVGWWWDATEYLYVCTNFNWPGRIGASRWVHYSMAWVWLALTRSTCWILICALMVL